MGLHVFGENGIESILRQKNVIEPKFWAGTMLKSHWDRWVSGKDHGWCHLQFSCPRGELNVCWPKTLWPKLTDEAKELGYPSEILILTLIKLIGNSPSHQWSHRSFSADTNNTSGRCWTWGQQNYSPCWWYVQHFIIPGVMLFLPWQFWFGSHR